MIVARKYTPEDAGCWNEFVRKSKNGTFLFDRGYMDYHADRFCDNSLMFHGEDGRLVGILPANVFDGVVYSHGGLTYGGLLIGARCHYSEVCEMFTAASSYLAGRGIGKLVYKPVPYIYSKQPSEEDIYWLYQNDAHLVQRAISSAVMLSSPLPFSELRQRKVRKAQNSGLVVRTDDFSYSANFWQILAENLMQRHSVSPVHSHDEICLLQRRFPENIFLSAVLDGEAVVAGCVVYKTDMVAHVQYIASDGRGKETGALDLLFNTLVQKYSLEGFKYLDFGISTENGGSFLNEGLLFQKEGFGGRAICYDTYEYKISGTK